MGHANFSDGEFPGLGHQGVQVVGGHPDGFDAVLAGLG